MFYTSLRLLSCLALGLTLHLSAATIKDIQGEWIIDGKATMDSVKKTSPMFAAMPAEQREGMTKIYLGMLANAEVIVTADKIVMNAKEPEVRDDKGAVVGGGGNTKEELTYKATIINGDKIEVEYKDEKGTPGKYICTLKGNTLTATAIDSTGKKTYDATLNRKTAAKAK